LDVSDCSKVRVHVQSVAAYLLVTNREFALGLFVLIGENLKLLHGLRLQDFDAEFDVALRVLVARLLLGQ
jgi:hypothetical protein